MSGETGSVRRITIKATESLTNAQYKAVDVDGTIAAANLQAAGILENHPENSGEAMTVMVAGQMPAIASAAIAKGARVKVTTSGFIVTVSSGDGSIGKALEAAASGDTIKILADFSNAGNTI